MKITFDLEGSDKEAAFYGIYAGLRMYKEKKDKEMVDKGMVGKSFFTAAAENYCRLDELKAQYPQWYAEAEKEYNEVNNVKTPD